MKTGDNGTALARKNARTLTLILAVVFGMVGLSFAAVPLYQLFCQVTGFGGTTMVAQSLPDTVLERTMRVRFNTDTGRNLNWRFNADARQIETRLGQQTIMSFTAENRSAVPVGGVAVYNVTPAKAGRYFHKLQCFCFGEQILAPGEKATYPVVFFIDPAMDNDPNMEDVRTITLSYTFFPSDTPELEAALEAYYAREAVSGTVALPHETQ